MRPPFANDRKAVSDSENRICLLHGERRPVHPRQLADMREPVSAGSLQALVYVSGFGRRNEIDLPAIVPESGPRVRNRPLLPSRSRLVCATCMGDRRRVAGHCGQPGRDDVGEIDDLESNGDKITVVGRFQQADASADATGPAPA